MFYLNCMMHSPKKQKDCSICKAREKIYTISMKQNVKKRALNKIAICLLAFGFGVFTLENISLVILGAWKYNWFLISNSYEFVSPFTIISLVVFLYGCVWLLMFHEGNLLTNVKKNKSVVIISGVFIIIYLTMSVLSIVTMLIAHV